MGRREVVLKKILFGEGVVQVNFVYLFFWANNKIMSPLVEIQGPFKARTVEHVSPFKRST